jgi:nucleotide-binding universal stress UspA family protein
MARKQSYQTILVGVDGSAQANYAYRSAIEVAKRNNGKIVVVVVVQNNMYDFLGYGNISEDFLNQAKKESQDLLDDLQKIAHKADFTNLETQVVYGNPKELLGDTLPRKYHVDLIMVGQSGLNAVERFMVGSVSQYVISHAPCVVLIVHPEKKE